MDSLKAYLSHPHTGWISSFTGVGVSLLDIEIYLRILGLSIGVIIALMNLFCRLVGNKCWFCK